MNALPMVGSYRIAHEGWGDCPNCKERLRSVALIGVFRFMVDQMAAVSGDGKQNMSLMEEAERSLSLARKEKQSGNVDKAIEEYTHAINAVNYYASTTSGTALILRPKDVLLICHAERAELEGNQSLVNSIRTTFPRASVKEIRKSENDITFSVDAFRALFYNLPAYRLLPNRGGNIMVDTRTQTVEGFIQSDAFKELKKLATNADDWEQLVSPVPPIHSDDPAFSSLGGIRKGVLAHYPVHLNLRDEADIPPMLSSIQIIWAFPSKKAASEYIRVTAERLLSGENKAPLYCQPNPSLTDDIKKTIRRHLADGENLKRLQVSVSKARIPNMHAVTFFCAVGCVATKLFCSCFSDEFFATFLNDTFPVLASKVALRLETFQKEYNGVQPPFHFMPDSTTCAYCGKNEPAGTTFSACSKCRITKVRVLLSNTVATTILVQLTNIPF